MKRPHVHIAAAHLDQSICFYAAPFAASPAVLKEDCGKCTVDGPSPEAKS